MHQRCFRLICTPTMRQSHSLKHDAAKRLSPLSHMSPDFTQSYSLLDSSSSSEFEHTKRLYLPSLHLLSAGPALRPLAAASALQGAPPQPPITSTCLTSLVSPSPSLSGSGLSHSTWPKRCRQICLRSCWGEPAAQRAWTSMTLLSLVHRRVAPAR